MYRGVAVVVAFLTTSGWATSAFEQKRLSLAALLLLGLGAACGSRIPSDSSLVARCHEGDQGCQCTSTGGCGSNLACVNAFCVPSQCEPGALGCQCLPAGICNPKDGKPLSCVGNVCTEVPLASPGQLGGICGTESTCAPKTGMTVACVNGICERADCPAGLLGCPCAAYGFCEPYRGLSPRCQDGTCSIGACVAGSLGCICLSGSGCDGELKCSDGLCRDQLRSMSISSSNAASCDILISTGGPRIANVAFDTSVVGSMAQRAPHAAFSVLRRSGGSLDGSLGRIHFETEPKSITVEKVNCYDRDGSLLPSPTVSFQ